MLNVVLQLTLPEYGKHLYKKSAFFCKNNVCMASGSTKDWRNI